MARFDRVCINPESHELANVLHLATLAANDRRRLRLLVWPLPDLDCLREIRTSSDGSKQWNGGEAPIRPGEGRAIVALAWWTDPLGRKHVRVVGRYGAFGRPMLTNLLCPFGEVRPALWFVYPDHVFLERQNGIRRAHALCACGVHGTPEELGWMGPSCDSCYDLGEEGVVPTQAWLDPKISTLFADEGRLQFLSWSPDGQTLAAGTSRDHITLWDTSTGLERGRLVGREEEWLLGVAWIDKGQRLISADARGRLCFWSAKTALPIGEPVEIGPSECFAVSDDGTICRGNRRGIQLLSSKDGSVILDPQDLLHEATTATFNADGTRFAAGNRHGQVKIYSQDGTCLASWQQEGSIVTSLAFGPNGRTLAIGLSPAPRTTGSESSGILLYDILERRVFVTLSGHANGTRCLTFAPDGRILASGGEDGIIRLWEVNGPQLGTERMALEWYLDCVSSIAFAPDGLTLAAGSFDGTIKLWPREVLRAVAVPSRSRESVGFPQMRRL